MYHLNNNPLLIYIYSTSRSSNTWIGSYQFFSARSGEVFWPFWGVTRADFNFVWNLTFYLVLIIRRLKLKIILFYGRCIDIVMHVWDTYWIQFCFHLLYLHCNNVCLYMVLTWWKGNFSLVMNLLKVGYYTRAFKNVQWIS